MLYYKELNTKINKKALERLYLNGFGHLHFSASSREKLGEWYGGATLDNCPLGSVVGRFPEDFTAAYSR